MTNDRGRRQFAGAFAFSASFAIAWPGPRSPIAVSWPLAPASFNKVKVDLNNVKNDAEAGAKRGFAGRSPAGGVQGRPEGRLRLWRPFRRRLGIETRHGWDEGQDRGARNPEPRTRNLEPGTRYPVPAIGSSLFPSLLLGRPLRPTIRSPKPKRRKQKRALVSAPKCLRIPELSKGLGINAIWACCRAGIPAALGGRARRSHGCGGQTCRKTLWIRCSSSVWPCRPRCTAISRSGLSHSSFRAGQTCPWFLSPRK